MCSFSLYCTFALIRVVLIKNGRKADRKNVGDIDILYFISQLLSIRKLKTGDPCYPQSWYPQFYYLQKLLTFQQKKHLEFGIFQL